MAQRLLNQNDRYEDDEGVVCAGGKLKFYITETSTPKNVFAESGLSTNLGATVDLDSSGRAESDIWLASDVLYRVELLDADDAQVWLRDDVGNATGAGLVPLDPATGTDLQVYSTDGADPYWRTIREVPDNTGHSGEVLTNDGEIDFWTPIATYDADNLPGGIEEATSYVQVGNTMFLRGTGTASTGLGTNNVTAAVVFTPAFDSAPVVNLTPYTAPVNGTGWHASATALNITASGFTASFYSDWEAHEGESETIDNAISYGWQATGSREP